MKRKIVSPYTTTTKTTPFVLVPKRVVSLSNHIHPVDYGRKWLIQHLLGFILLLLLAAFNTQAYAQPQTKHYNIPAGSLASALNKLAESSDLQVIYDTDLTQDLTSNGLKGTYSTDAALQKLLSGTSLVYTLTDEMVNIQAAEKPTTKPLLPVADASSGNSESMSESTLPKVTVEADADNPYDDPTWQTDPYNTDYVLPNATVGTKTNTPIMETPLNVQVISKQVLKNQQVINFKDSLKNISGVTTANNVANTAGGGGNSQGIILRGFESQTFFRNGFRMQESSASRPMANVESVEVLKGAAAILYGQVEPGGMVNVITKQPLATPYHGFTQQFGSYDLYRTTIDTTGPIANNKDVLYRMNMSYENSGSFRQFVDKEDVFLAPVLKWNISPKTQATFELEYNHQHFGADSGFVPLFNGNISNTPISRNYGEPSPATTETIFGGFNWSHQFNDDWSIKHRFSVNQQNNNQPFNVLPNSMDKNNVYRRVETATSQFNTYSTNLDLVGHFDTYGLKHTLLFGGDYYRLDTKFDRSIGLVGEDLDLSKIGFNNPMHPGSPFVGSLTKFDFSNTLTDQYGLYVQDQIKLPYDFQVMGGIRYQYIHVNKKDLLNSTATSVQTQDAVTPRVGILWQPKSWLSLYANYVESFGANSGSTAPGKTVPPSSAEQYEGGIKTELFGGRLRATLAYYDLTKTNIATTDPRPSRGDFVVVTGEARSRGSELDITGEILPGWNVIATWANIDVRVTKTNSNNDFGLDGLVPVGGRFFNVPRNKGSLWSTYEVQEGNLRGLKFGGGVNLSVGQTGCCDNPAAKIPGYATVDLLAAYSHNLGDAKITAQLNVNNLLDKRYFTGIGTFGNGLTGFQAANVDFGQPRTFMGTINVQY